MDGRKVGAGAWVPTVDVRRVPRSGTTLAPCRRSMGVGTGVPTLVYEVGGGVEEYNNQSEDDCVCSGDVGDVGGEEEHFHEEIVVCIDQGRCHKGK